MSKINRIIEEMEELTDEERLEIIRSFCRYCGSKEVTCVCWNDE